MISRYPRHYYECSICGDSYEDYDERQKCIDSHPTIEITGAGGWDDTTNYPRVLFVKVGEKRLVYSFVHEFKSQNALTDEPEVYRKAELSA
jgi:2'-5' RNA ligase